MPTATEAAKAPAWKVKKFTGELPAVNGKERVPSPFDDVVKASFDSGDTMIVEAAQNDELRTKIVAQLHKAAKFHGVGLDLWRSLPEGIAFKARAKRDNGKATMPARADATATA